VGTWVSKAPMPTARYDLSAGVFGGKLYAMGGYAGGRERLNNEEYDPVTDTWASRSQVPYLARNLGVASTDSGLYAMGSSLSSVMSQNQFYDPLTDVWQQRASIVSPAQGDLCVGTVLGKVYAVGGGSSGAGATTNREYDPATDTWSIKQSAPNGHRGGAVGVLNDKLYVAGGSSVGLGFDAYDPLTDTWETLPQLPYTGGVNPGLGGGFIKGRFYVVGFSPGRITLEYDPNTGTWSERALKPTSTPALGAGIISGRLYAVGGGGVSVAYNVNEEYTPPQLDPELFSVSPSAIPSDSVVEVVVSGALLAHVTSLWLQPGDYQLTITEQTNDEIKALIDTTQLAQGVYLLFGVYPGGQTNALTIEVLPFSPAENQAHIVARTWVARENMAHIQASLPAPQRVRADIYVERKVPGNRLAHVTAEQKVVKENHAHIRAFTYPPYQVFAQVKAFQRLDRENKAHVKALQKTQERHNFAQVVAKGRVLGETKAHIHAIQYPPWNNFVQVHVRQWVPRFNRVHVQTDIITQLLWKRVGAHDPFWRIIPPHKR